MKTAFSILLLFATNVFASCELTPSQQSIVHFSYSYGAPHDFGLTMVAIAMEESDLGRYRINLQDPSVSSWGVTVSKAIKKLGWRDTPFNRNRAAQLMLNDIYFSAGLALETLLWWNDVRDGDWRRVVESYNAGYGSNKEYVSRIIENINTIKQCKWLEEQQ